MTASAPASICLVRLSALGDLFLLLPAVQALCDALPEARITWLIERRFLPVVQHLAGRIELYPVDGPRTLAEYRRIRRDFAGRHFDVLLAMQAKLRSNLIYPLIPASRKIGFDDRRARDGHGWFVDERIARADEHLADGFLAFMRQIGVMAVPRNWAPPLTSEALVWRARLLGDEPYLVINPSASKAERDWPLPQQEEFLRRLPETGWQGRVVITGSNPEQSARLAACVPNGNGLSVAGQTTLPQLFALLAGAALLVSPDSGPIHIARAYAVPVVGLYAVARLGLSGPWQATEYCVDAYAQALQTLLGKNPAIADWHQRVHDPRAMALIPVDSVLEQTRRALGVRS
ncbi:glycosyltransferase family 9 protein [Chitinilyticum piscinae]|uniref:Glycosyltransferase family 9 protein n=1 Tax=Chitinilyticum piscinae TaxID=2866724 RepID=A0A8J7FLH0_9NEIS|nr:glycosyltransferase family 9 protein [Chitinilyticum piscinae]MBE9608461.1 glycosyltransferase family 9 protein [Chitinilyticum piscinae]